MLTLMMLCYLQAKKRRHGSRGSTKRCNCGHDWCKAKESDGLQRVPAPKNNPNCAGKRGDLWIRRVFATAAIQRQLVRWKEGKDVYLARHHFYNDDIKLPDTPTGYMTIGSVSFNRDPRFRSKDEIVNGVTAPRSSITAVVAPAPSAPPAAPLTQTSVPPPQQTNARRAPKERAPTMEAARSESEPGRRAHQFEAVTRELEDHVQVLTRDLANTRSELADTKERAAQGLKSSLLSFEKMTTDPHFPVKVILTLACPAQLHPISNPPLYCHLQPHLHLTIKHTQTLPMPFPDVH